MINNYWIRNIVSEFIYEVLLVVESIKSMFQRYITTQKIFSSLEENTHIQMFLEEH